MMVSTLLSIYFILGLIGTCEVQVLLQKGCQPNLVATIHIIVFIQGHPEVLERGLEILDADISPKKETDNINKTQLEMKNMSFLFLIFSPDSLPVVICIVLCIETCTGLPY